MGAPIIRTHMIHKIRPQGEDFSASECYVRWPRDSDVSLNFGYYGVFDGHGGQVGGVCVGNLFGQKLTHDLVWGGAV